MWDEEPDDGVIAEYESLDDLLRTTSETFLGLTIGCARCHDHKLDPIPQQDYYGLLAFFSNVYYFEETYANTAYYRTDQAPIASSNELVSWRDERDKHLKLLATKLEEIYQPLREKLMAERLADLPEKLRMAYLTPAGHRSDEQQQLAMEEKFRIQPAKNEIPNKLSAKAQKKRSEILQKIKNIKQRPFSTRMAVSESGSVPEKTYFLIAGNPAAGGREIQPAFPKVLTDISPRFPAPSSTRAGGMDCQQGQPVDGTRAGQSIVVSPFQAGDCRKS